MILTLTWKEICEHRAIWLAMVVLTGVLGLGLARIVAPTDANLAAAVATLTNLGMAAVYGVVCGAMMLAGEHESGTLPLLDIFLGRRGLLWLGKFLIGIVLVLIEALAVALALYLLRQVPPAWSVAILGLGDQAAVGAQARRALPTGPELWFLLLPVVTLEAYAWGLFGSALNRRVLPAAAFSGVVATPIWLLALCMPSAILFGLRLAAAVLVLFVSYAIFVSQPRDAPLGPVPPPDEPEDPRRKFIDLYDELERDVPALPHQERPILAPPVPAAAEASGGWEGPPVAVAKPQSRRQRTQTEAPTPQAVLWWLTLQQAGGTCLVLALASLLVGILMPAAGQALWPLATLLLGVACGTATFAAEQRDLTYQFLAAQHLPLPLIWRFKTLFWLSAAILATLLLALGGLLLIGGQATLHIADAQHLPSRFDFGTLHALLGPVLFFTIWLAYGFCAGQVFVWFCRKTILALLLAGLASAGALGLWLPSLLCRGMSGWQLWLLPLLTLSATRLLVRAWAGGRIKERRPVLALVVCGLLALAWVGGNLVYRALEIPNVGPPLDPVAFRATIPSGAENVAGHKMQLALTAIEDAAGKEEVWLAHIAAGARLPVGMIEIPRSDGQAPNLRHLPFVPKMTERLRTRATKEQAAGRADAAFEHLAEILALARNLQNKAPATSYLVGVWTEASALDGLDQWLAAGKPAPAQLRRVLEELNRHAAETPPALDCLRTECFRAGGLLAVPTLWVKSPDQLPERWLAGSIALSLEMPWEDERKTRLWQLVWAGLFRTLEAPPGRQAPAPADPGVGSDATRRILSGWLPAATGPGASMTAAQLARLLDASWLADDRHFKLFAPVVLLRHAATRARCRLDTIRLAVALALYRQVQQRPAQGLDELVPKYLPQLPLDPYSGQAFHYRISVGERIDGLGNVPPGQGVVWSTGPDGVDHGGRKHGEMPPEDPRWQRGDFDRVRLVP